MERSELLALPVFDGIRAENLPKMLDCLGCYEKHYRKNEMIMLEEETVRRIGVVLSGTVHMIKEDIDGGKSLMVTIRRAFWREFRLRQPALGACQLCRSGAVRSAFSAVPQGDPFLHAGLHVSPSADRKYAAPAQ